MVQFTKNTICQECLMKSFLMLKMTPEEIEEINKSRVEVRFKKGDVICRQGTIPTYLIYISKGYAKQFIDGNNPVIMQIITQGNYVGLQAAFAEDAFTQTTYKYTVTALDEVHACFIDINKFKRIVRNNVSVCYEVTRYISKNEDFLLGRIQTSIQKNSRGRIADMLLYISELSTLKDLKIQLTRKEMAEIAGTSLENLIRILSELNRENIIKVNGKDIEILNFELLRKIQELG